MIRFPASPPNDFREFADAYFQAFREHCPAVAALAGKWNFEDLIPGLSDLDPRLVVEDGMTPEDWCAASSALGQAQLDLCRRRPHWVRNLEHLPGISVAWSELTGRATPSPEYPQWTFYAVSRPDRLDAAQARLAAAPWDAEGERYHLERFCLYAGRYDRDIDRPVNVGEWEAEYPLHSRFMHYFAPAVQSAVSLVMRRSVRGKLESFRLGRDLFDEPTCAEALDVVARHYEADDLYSEPALTALDDRLEAALARIRVRLAPFVSLIADASGRTLAEWRAEVARLPEHPFRRAFFCLCFARLLKGRLLYYADAPPHFDSAWLIENELRRIRRTFFDVPLGILLRLSPGGDAVNAEAALAGMTPGLLTAEEARCTAEYLRLLALPRDAGSLRQIARQVAAVFDGLFLALCKAVERIRELSGDSLCASGP